MDSTEIAKTLLGAFALYNGIGITLDVLSGDRSVRTSMLMRGIHTFGVLFIAWMWLT